MTIPTTRPEALTRLFDTNSTASDYALAGDGLFVPTTRSDPGFMSLSGYRGVTSIGFSGVGADNSTAKVRVYGALEIQDHGSNPAKDPPVAIFLGHMFDLTATLGTLAPPAGVAIPAGEVMADTILADGDTGFWTHILAMFGGARNVYSPANNTLGLVSISDLANIAGLYFDVNLADGGGTAMTSLNILVARGT